MKFKKLAKTTAAVILGATMSFSVFAATGCGGNTPAGGGDDDGGIDVLGATLEMTTDKTQINAGTNETITATVEATGLPDNSVVWSIEGNGVSYVEINQNGVLSLKSGITPKLDQAVKIVATSTYSSLVKASATIIIKAQVIPGQVGELTTEMLTNLGNSSITVTGKVSDIYDDLNNENNDVTSNYDFTVMMSDGAWYGEWNRENSKDKDANNYRRSEDVIPGTDTHTFNQVYINKDNEVAQKAVTDYNSIAAIWEDQHLWNHLAQLGTDIENQWEYDAINEVYVYQFDNNSEEDLYFRTYLAFSLTPMLGNSDTLEQIMLTIEDGEITTLQASTAVTYYGSDSETSSSGATAMSYTLLTCEFTDVGTTVVPDPQVYEAPEHADLLEQALANMGDATNYTFNAVDTTVSGPSYDDSDYSQYSVSTYMTSAYDTVSSSGTVGLVGKVTSDAILLARTDEYTYTQDGNNFWTKYSGYKQIDAETYDYFEFDSTLMALAGQRQYKGNIFDNMPKFDFSANVFEYAGMTEIKKDDKWVGVYNFTLRESAITRDVAMQLSAHSYASSAAGSTHGTLKITVLGTGELVSAEYPYSLVSGTYLGTIKTTYTNVGTTTLPEDTFEGYAPRVLKTSWSQYDVMYYHADHSTASGFDKIDAATLFGQMFGDKASNIPAPTAFYNAFGDAMSGPFFDWSEEDNTATGGDIIYHDIVSLTLSIDGADENGKISDQQHDEAIAKLTAELKAYGFEISAPNTAVTYWGDRYTTYISEGGNGNIMIKIENNRTRYFFVEIITVGMWTYNHDYDTAPTA